jgi:UDP-N-acetylmuramate dehydrogenase
LFEQIYTEKPFDFTKHSTIGCGGFAKVAYYPKDETETLFLLSACKDGWVALGNLSNVLPSDEGLNKTVICTKRLTQIRRTADGAFVSAGVTSGGLLRYAKENGLRGAEFLIGIPCTLGGILYMNGGAGGKYIADIVKSVRIVREGKAIDLTVKECGYSYKNSVFMRTKDFILGATLRLEKSTKTDIEREIQGWLSKRAHLPKGKSMGCVFKNPQGAFAGELIEKTGLKGFRIGGAKVSEEHANFIINDKNATAEEIRALISVIKNAVLAQYGITLEEEIQYLP